MGLLSFREITWPSADLWEIENNPELVQAFLNVPILQPGIEQELTPQLVLPDGVLAQMIPATIRIQQVQE